MLQVRSKIKEKAGMLTVAIFQSQSLGRIWAKVRGCKEWIKSTGDQKTGKLGSYEI
jgi:hypothetical protein